MDSLAQLHSAGPVAPVGAPRSALARLGLAVLIGGVAAASVGVGEMAARMALPDIDPARQIKFVAGEGDVPILGPRDISLRQVKNTGDFNVSVSFNRHGFRDRGDVAASKPGDIVLVGDSFMLGWGIEEDQRTSNRLGALVGRPVYNVAIPTDIDGFEQLLDYARRLGGRFSRVVVGVTMEMDLKMYGADTATAPTAPAAPPPAPDWAARLAAVKTGLRDNSALYFVLTGLVHHNPLLAEAAARVGVLRPNLDGIHRNRFAPEIVTSSADRLAELASHYDAIVLIVPSRALWHGGNESEEVRRHDAFVTALRARGVDVVDPRPAMEAEGRGLAYHFANDGHWRAAGHDLAARLLAERVKARWGGT